MLYKGSELIPLANRSKEKRPLPVHLLNDYLCGGLFEGLYVIGADPGMGKSMLCIQFGMEAAMAGYKVLYMSAEMSGSIVGQRISTMYPEIPASILDNFFVVDDKSITSDYIIKLADELNPDLIIVDYLQFIAQPSNKRNQMDMKDVVKCTLTALLTIIASHNIPIIALSSLVKTSSSGTRGVGMHDFKDSSNIEYDADFLIGLQYDGIREGKAVRIKDVDNATYKKLEVVTLKDRHCKLKQSAKLFLDKQHCIFISEEPITEDILEDEITVWE